MCDGPLEVQQRRGIESHASVSWSDSQCCKEMSAAARLLRRVMMTTSGAKKGRWNDGYPVGASVRVFSGVDDGHVREIRAQFSL